MSHSLSSTALLQLHFLDSVGGASLQGGGGGGESSSLPPPEQFNTLWNSNYSASSASGQWPQTPTCAASISPSSSSSSCSLATTAPPPPTTNKLNITFSLPPYIPHTVLPPLPRSFSTPALLSHPSTSLVHSILPPAAHPLPPPAVADDPTFFDYDDEAFTGADLSEFFMSSSFESLEETSLPSSSSGATTLATLSPTASASTSSSLLLTPLPKKSSSSSHITGLKRDRGSGGGAVAAALSVSFVSSDLPSSFSFGSTTSLDAEDLFGDSGSSSRKKARVE